MEINIDAFAQGTINLPVGRLSTGVTDKRYHGFHCGVGRIIESPAVPDKQSCARKPETLAGWRTADCGGAHPDPRLWDAEFA
jgi:hypothetical protein